MKPSFAPLDLHGKQFLTDRTGIEFRHVDMRGWLCATARDDYGHILGVLAVEPKLPFDWHFNAAIADPRCMSKRLLRTIFTTLFRMGAVRITALIAPDNQQAIKSAARLGFVYEGFIRQGVEGHRDALMFGMLKSDCRFLGHPTSRSRHGEILGLRHPGNMSGIDTPQMASVAAMPSNGFREGR